MTYFKFDIPKINENISMYKDIKQNCIEDVNLVYRVLGYTESAWNDPSAYAFIEKVKRDKYKLNEYFNYLDRLHGEISQFKENIDNICSKYGYRRNSITLKFDDSELESCKKYLNDAITLLNDCLNKIYPYSYYKYGCVNSVYTLQEEIKLMKKNINTILKSITDITKSINNEIEDSKFRLKRISGFEYGLKTTDYNWKSVDLNAKKDTVDVTSMMNYSGIGIGNAKIEEVSNETVNLENKHTIYSSNIKSNELKNVEQEHSINEVTPHSIKTKRDDEVDLDDVKKVKLNDYTNINPKVQNEIVFEPSDNLTLHTTTFNYNNKDNKIVFENLNNDSNLKYVGSVQKNSSNNNDFNIKDNINE